MCSSCSLTSFKSLTQTKLHRFPHTGLTEEEDLTMSSDVNRQAVFQATKVRTHLKKDGSWIHRYEEVLDTQSDVKCKPVKLVKPQNESSPESSRVSSSIMPCSQSGTASSSLDSSTTPQSSYVMSALKKFEPVSSTENTPVKSGSQMAKSPYPVLEDSKRAHVEGVVEKLTVKSVEEPPADSPVKDVAENPVVKPEEEPLKTPAGAPVKDVVKKPVVKPAEDQLKTPAGAPVKDVVKKPVVKPAEEPLKTPADSPKKDVVEKPIDKPANEALKTHADTPKMDLVEKPIIKLVEEPLKTPADSPVKDVVEKTLDKPGEEPLKTHADAPKNDLLEKPIVKLVEEPLKTPADSPVKDVVEKPIVKLEEEPLKTPADTPVKVTGKTTVDRVSTDQRQSSGALQEKTAQTLHENPSKPSGALTTEKKEDNPVEQLTTAHAPVVETPLKPRQAENQPTSNDGELSLISALKTPTTESSDGATKEPTEEPLVEAPAEHHRLNSEAGLNVKGKIMCSFCKLPLNGNVKISINIPDICCHPDCFKCNGCSSPLGDLSISMYHYCGKVLCERCFEQIFQL
ncbi:hypothetical protein ABG768_022872 [Culter alburnus]|uniref:LIM zinc-binding domain-containing protein n=1 Tax=Culter alburnus TaxID=194366 RepID=A0AAW2APA1_CULAL